jgi:hypothetical protein
LLGRVENPAELERLLNEAGSGPELEKLLSDFPKRSAAELEKSSVESLKKELKAKEEGGLERGASKHPGKYKNKKLVDAENNLVARTKAKDGHDVGVDVNGEPLVCTYCTLMRRDFVAELAVEGDKEIDAIKADMDIIDKMTDAEKQAEEYAKVEDRLKKYKEQKLPAPTIILNSKGVLYPKVSVEGYGEIPFPKGPYTPNNSSLLRPSFTDSYKLKFKDWWIKQGKPWPETPMGTKINIHHIKPLGHGGTNAFDNLVPLIQPIEHQPFTSWWASFKII